MKRLFVSQPMTGRSETDILRKKEELVSIANQIIDEDIEVINSYFDDQPDINFGDGSISVYYLGKAIQVLSMADMVIFAEDWRNSAGCITERNICELYGIPFIEYCENGWNIKMVRRWLKDVKL